MGEKTRTYEGMFLVDSGKSDFEAACQPIRNVLDRSQAQILTIKPWDERKLAYEIGGRRRALYVLTYFKIDPASTSDIERHSDLIEEILRVLILRHDELTEEQINAKTPAEAAARRARPPRPDTSPPKDDSDGKEAKPAKRQEEGPAPAAEDQQADTKPADQTSKEPQT